MYPHLTLEQVDLFEAPPAPAGVFYNRVEATQTKAKEGKLTMSTPISDLFDRSYILNVTY